MSNNAIKPLPEDHKFIFSKLNYDAKPNFEPAIKISVFFRKREDITHEEFFKHWQTVHADLTLAVQSFQDNIIRYSQHHQTPEMKARLTSLGQQVLDYDACAQLWVRDWDSWLKFCNCPEYSAALTDDCDRFISLPLTYMVGHENLIVGSAAQELGGRNGFSMRASKL